MQLIKEVASAPRPVGPYSVAVKSGAHLYCSGQIGVVPETGKIIEGGIVPQTGQVMRNLSAVLVSQGLTFNNVVMTTIFLTSMESYQEVNRVYGSLLGEGVAPARQTIAVKELPLGALVEISMIAEMS